MRDPQTKHIDGILFEVTPLGHKQGRKVFTRLSKAVGPALAKAMGEAKSVDDVTEGGLVEAVESLADSVSDDDLEWLEGILGESTRYSLDGEKTPFLREANREALFSGRIHLYFQWLAFALEVNFSDFLAWLKRVASAAARDGREKIKSESND